MTALSIQYAVLRLIERNAETNDSALQPVRRFDDRLSPRNSAPSGASQNILRRTSQPDSLRVVEDDDRHRGAGRELDRDRYT